jgi:hypothetical protein
MKKINQILFWICLVLALIDANGMVAAPTYELRREFMYSGLICVVGAVANYLLLPKSLKKPTK